MSNQEKKQVKEIEKALKHFEAELVSLEEKKSEIELLLLDSSTFSIETRKELEKDLRRNDDNIITTEYQIRWEKQELQKITKR